MDVAAAVTAIVARQEPTAISKPLDPQRRLSLVKVLTGLAEARQTSVSAETLKLYSAHLCDFDPNDVREVVRTLAMRKRAEGETSFPALGDLVEPLLRLRRRRREEHNRATQRQSEVDEFWRWAAEWMEATGNDKAELLRRFPGYKGTKPR
jgi:hypothetical protein